MRRRHPEEPLVGKSEQQNNFFFFSFLKMIVFIHFTALLRGLFSAVGAAFQLWSMGFSLRGLLLLWSSGFSACSTWAQQLWLLASRAQAQ